MNIKSKLLAFFLKNMIFPDQSFKPVAGVIVFTNPHGEYKSICYHAPSEQIFIKEGAPELFKEWNDYEK